MAKKKKQPAVLAGDLFQSQETNEPAPVFVPPAPLKLKSERINDWQKVAVKMFKWFEDLKELPAEPIQITKYFKIVNCKKFIETQRATIESNFKDPFNRCFNTAYMRLYQLKKFIEK